MNSSKNTSSWHLNYVAILIIINLERTLCIAARKDRNGKEIRPLSDLITRLRKQSNTKAPKYAWYELNMIDQFMENSHL